MGQPVQLVTVATQGVEGLLVARAVFGLYSWARDLPRPPRLPIPVMPLRIHQYSSRPNSTAGPNHSSRPSHHGVLVGLAVTLTPSACSLPNNAIKR
jgi:hypothetical protein